MTIRDAGIQFLSEVKGSMDQATRSKGQLYKYKVYNAIVGSDKEEHIIIVKAEVQGTELYKTHILCDIMLDDTIKLHNTSCTCAAMQRYGECKHVAGLAIYITDTNKFQDAFEEYIREDIAGTHVDIDDDQDDEIPSIEKYRSRFEGFSPVETHNLVESILKDIELGFEEIQRYSRYYSDRGEERVQSLYKEILEKTSIFLLLRQANPQTRIYLDEHPKETKTLDTLINSGMTQDMVGREELVAYLELAKADEYLNYFDQIYTQEQESLTDQNLSAVNVSKYIYSLRLEISDQDIYPVLIEHKPRKTGGWTKGKKIKAEKFDTKNLPDHLVGILNFENRYRSGSPTKSFAQEGRKLIDLIRKQEEISRQHDTSYAITGREDDAFLVYVLTKNDDNTYIVQGDISYHGVRQGFDVLARHSICLCVDQESKYRAICDPKSKLMFFHSSAPEPLIYKLFDGGVHMTAEQFERFQNKPGFEVFIKHVEDKDELLGEVIAPMDPSLLVTIKFDDTYTHVESEILFYYDESRNTEVSLGDFRYYFSPENPQRYMRNLSGDLIGRNFDMEQNMIKPVLLFLERRYDEVDIHIGTASKKLDQSSVQFFDAIDEEISQGLTVAYYQKAKKIISSPVSMSVTITSGVDRFDTTISLKSGETKIDDADIIRDAIHRQEKLVTLKDGTMMRLHDDLLQAKEHMQALGLDAKKSGTQRLSHAQVGLMQDSKTLLFDMDEHAQMLRHKVRNFEKITPVDIPKTILATLREYQHIGVNRLSFLQEYGFSGILADDMGLGKTLQTIVILANLYNQSTQKTAPSLVVCPTSLVYNRYDEIQKFCPSLSATIISSGKDDIYVGDSKDTHIYIVSYGILANKIKAGELADDVFTYIVLDESQHIKNPQSGRAKALCQLQGNYRLALSGTPIENNLSELRSVFHFLMPGFLGSLGKFQKQWMKGEPDLSLLSKKVRSFILRRTKEEVLTDLPPKVEEVIYLEMEPKQRALYTKLEKTYKKQIFDKIGDEGLNKSRFQVLDALLKLRQVCLSPELLKLTGNNVKQSAKLTYIQENVEDMLHSGHSLLIFSQFTGFLAKVKEVFDDKEITYLYLDGQTPAKKRKELVNEFNDGKVKVFIISLKAGGTGLNLVAADYVIHMDPRRNPAVQQQATDRAHRMGQEKTVFVQNLIMKDSIEEKILQLQEKKKQLIDDVFSGNFSGSLTEDDVKFVFGG